MNTKNYILSIDQGTTSSRAILFNEKAEIVKISQNEITQIYPQSAWVEHDPIEIWETTFSVINEVISKAKIQANQLKAIGITNQRETTILWDKNTGKPIYNAIVWQDKRTKKLCEDLKKQGLEPYFKEKTGLVLDAYFSGTKINWILDNVPDARKKAKNGEVLAGTIETWLLWKLTNGNVHATDVSNASRTLLFDIHQLIWDEKILEILDIPKNILPEVKSSSGNFGTFNFEGIEIPITGIAGDQQAALFGQTCFQSGMVKNTYGTGCFMLMNTGKKAIQSKNGLLTTIAWKIKNETFYALEGSVFMAGSAIQWLRDELKIIDSAQETEEIAKSITEENEIYVVPAFAGLGAPYWNPDAKGMILGLTRDSNKNHIIKATLESLAYQSMDLLEAMKQDAKIELKNLQVDGGGANNNYLMQFQSDVLNLQIEKPEITESTALGVAFLAGIGIGLWTQEEILNFRKIQQSFQPKMKSELKTKKIKGWKKAVELVNKFT